MKIMKSILTPRRPALWCLLTIVSLGLTACRTSPLPTETLPRTSRSGLTGPSSSMTAVSTPSTSPTTQHDRKEETKTQPLPARLHLAEAKWTGARWEKQGTVSLPSPEAVEEQFQLASNPYQHRQLHLLAVEGNTFYLGLNEYSMLASGGSRYSGNTLALLRLEQKTGKLRLLFNWEKEEAGPADVVSYGESSYAMKRRGESVSIFALDGKKNPLVFQGKTEAKNVLPRLSFSAEGPVFATQKMEGEKPLKDFALYRMQGQTAVEILPSLGWPQFALSPGSNKTSASSASSASSALSAEQDPLFSLPFSNISPARQPWWSYLSKQPSAFHRLEGRQMKVYPLEETVVSVYPLEDVLLCNAVQNVEGESPEEAARLPYRHQIFSLPFNGGKKTPLSVPEPILSQGALQIGKNQLLYIAHVEGADRVVRLALAPDGRLLDREVYPLPLQDQPLLQEAEDGSLLLLQQEGTEAVLYRLQPK